MGLFSHKEGGTFFGNLLRGIGQTVSRVVGLPGLLGAGANKIEIGQTKTNAQLYKEAAAAAGQSGTEVANLITGQTAAPVSGSTFKYVVLGFVGVIGIMLIAFKDKIFGKSGGSYHNHY